jgi:hypothetical protein
VNGFPDVFAFPGLRIAADIDANHPCTGSTADDLASLSSHTCLLKHEKAAHVAAAEGWFYWWVSEGETGGRSAPAVSLKARGVVPSRAHNRHTGAEEIGFYRGSRGCSRWEV